MSGLKTSAQLDKENEERKKREKKGKRNEEKTYARANQRQHCPLIQSQCFALFHFDSLFIQTLHCIHFTRISFSATINFTKATASNNTMNTEIIHCQLKIESNRLGTEQSNATNPKRNGNSSFYLNV